MQSEIKRWGNSAAVRLPTRILAQAQLEMSSLIDIEVVDGKIVIAAAPEPANKLKLPFSEADLLAGLNEDSAHADLLASPMDKEFGDE